MQQSGRADDAAGAGPRRFPARKPMQLAIEGCEQDVALGSARAKPARLSARHRPVPADGSDAAFIAAIVRARVAVPPGPNAPARRARQWPATPRSERRLPARPLRSARPSAPPT